MSTAAITQTNAKTNVWLKELALKLDWEEPDMVFKALRTVLHLLRDRLPTVESAQLASQLPMLIRGAFYENWVPKEHPEHMSAERFVGHVAIAFPRDFTVNPESITRAVFSLLTEHVSPGEIEDVCSCLGKDYQELWA